MSQPPASSDDDAARLYDEARSPSAPAGGRKAPPPIAEIQPRFPDLEIEDVIGQGGMGVVYRARQRRLDRVVALKVLPAHLGDDPAFAERFAREARTMARLDHPNIVRVYDFGEAEGLYYLVLEHVDGANLREVLRAGHLEPDEAIAIVPQLCEALQYAHDQGVVHRDIKPENVLLDKQGRVKVADFGLVKLAGSDAYDATLTGTGQVMGTPHYMAPEQYREPQDVDHRADIFSLGVVFYEMLTGELPVGRFKPPSEAQVVDRRIDAIVLRTLERERDLRYQRACDVESDLTRLSQPAARLEKELPAPPRRSTAAIALWASALALPLGFLAVGFASSVWGGVERGTTEVFHREILKAAAGSLVWIVGVIAGLFALVQSARLGKRGPAFRIGIVLVLLNLLLVPAMAWFAMYEAERHAELPRTKEADGLPGSRADADRLWSEIAALMAHRSLSLEEALPFYAEADQVLLRGLTESELTSRRRAHAVGAALLFSSVFGDDAPGFWVQGINRFGRGPVQATLVHPDRATEIRFPIVFEGGRWRLRATPVRVKEER